MIELVVLAFLVLCVLKLHSINRRLIERIQVDNERHNKLLDYIEILHIHGVRSHEAREFKLGMTDDELFIQWARMMDRIFSMMERVWEGHMRVPE